MKKKTNTIEVSLEGRKIHLLGTAHISEESVKDVQAAIEELKPDFVAIELDEERLRKIQQQKETWMELDLFKIIREGKSFVLLTSIILSSFQRKLGEQMNTMPGSEMIAAVKECEQRKIPLVLVDRSVSVTLKRAWRLSSFWGKQKVIAALVAVIFSKKEINSEELEELKTKSIEGNILQELSETLPNLKTVFLDERDDYMAAKLYHVEGKKVLGVFGAAHVRGIQEKLQNRDPKTFSQERIRQLEEVPKKKRFSLLHLIVPLFFVSFLVYAFMTGGWSQVSQNFIAWWLINGGLSLVGALLSLAHPITMVVSFLAAPITSLIPVIGVGFFTGLSETFFRTPKGKDIVDLHKLKLSFRSLYANAVSRILIVIFATSAGSALGTFLGFTFFAINSA